MAPNESTKRAHASVCSFKLPVSSHRQPKFDRPAVLSCDDRFVECSHVSAYTRRRSHIQSHVQIHLFMVYSRSRQKSGKLTENKPTQQKVRIDLGKAFAITKDVTARG